MTDPHDDRRRSSDRELGEISVMLRSLHDDMKDLKAAIASDSARIAGLEAKANVGKGVLWAAGLALPTIGGAIGAFVTRMLSGGNGSIGPPFIGGGP